MCLISRYSDKEKKRHVSIFDLILNNSPGLRQTLLSGDFDRFAFEGKENAVMTYILKMVSLVQFLTCFLLVKLLQYIL